MAKPICQVCGQTYRGIALITVKDGKEVEVCPVCYKALDAAYRKNSCLACVFFHVGTCELFGTELDEPYVQSARCEYFTTNPDSAVVADVKARAEVALSAFKEKSVQLLTMDDLSQSWVTGGRCLRTSVVIVANPSRLVSSRKSKKHALVASMICQLLIW